MDEWLPNPTNPTQPTELKTKPPQLNPATSIDANHFFKASGSSSAEASNKRPCSKSSPRFEGFRWVQPGRQNGINPPYLCLVKLHPKKIWGFFCLGEPWPCWFLQEWYSYLLANVEVNATPSQICCVFLIRFGSCINYVLETTERLPSDSTFKRTTSA